MSVCFAFPSAEIRLGWRPGRGHHQRGVREKILAEGEPIGGRNSRARPEEPNRLFDPARAMAK